MASGRVSALVWSGVAVLFVAAAAFTIAVTSDAKVDDLKRAWSECIADASRANCNADISDAETAHTIALWSGIGASVVAGVLFLAALVLWLVESSKAPALPVVAPPPAPPRAAGRSASRECPSCGQDGSGIETPWGPALGHVGPTSCKVLAWR